MQRGSGVRRTGGEVLRLLMCTGCTAWISCFMAKTETETDKAHFYILYCFDLFAIIYYCSEVLWDVKEIESFDQFINKFIECILHLLPSWEIVVFSFSQDIIDGSGYFIHVSLCFFLVCVLFFILSYTNFIYLSRFVWFLFSQMK